MKRFVSPARLPFPLPLLLAASIAVATGCGLDAVVGGSCRDGFTEIGGRCVPASAGGVGDAPTESSSPTLPATSNANPSATPSATSSATPPSSPPDGGADASPPDGGADGATPPPALVCEPPLQICRGQCMSFDSDPLNCGACGRWCPSNICVAGRCLGATPGDVVVVGHALTNGWSESMHARAVANAVSIPTTDPIRILSYEEGVSSDAAVAMRSILQADVARTIQFTTASAASLTDEALYARYDVVLVPGAAVADPAGLGASWSHALQTFTRSGGVFVAVDGGESDVPALVDATGLVRSGGHFPLVSSTWFTVSAPNDVVVSHLLSPFAAFGTSVAFPDVQETADLKVVVRTDDGSGWPTVLHATVR